MHLTRFSDMGLRVLIYLARADADRPLVTIAEVASQFDLPLNHLVKVAAKLSQAGWINAQRGRHGGMRLSADPAKLKIGSVLRILEGEDELIDCVGQDCSLQLDCRLRAALKTGQRAFYDAMDRFALADMVRGSTGEQIVQMQHKYAS